MSILNQRRYERVPTVVLVDLYTPGSGLSKGRGCVVDISLGGLAIETTLELTDGTELVFEIEKGMPIHGRVVNVRQQLPVNRYGLVYTQLSFWKRLRLWMYVRRLLRVQKYVAASVFLFFLGRMIV